jgi:succinate-semialdehyde dehydrogenase/glutarate-semialdehyde dehydrogenase
VAYETIDPTTEERLETFPEPGDVEVERALGRAWDAFVRWRDLPLARRVEPLQRAAALLEANAAAHALRMAQEMGKPVTEGEAEVQKCAWGCRYYAEHAEEFLAPERRVSGSADGDVRFEPLGPVLAIMPWNFPYWQVFRFGAPALAAGNAVLLKHAPNTPRCALAIESLLLEAGFPPGLVQSVFLSNDQAARVLADRRVRGVTLTGSTRAGREVASSAGRALKPMVMELGGSDPFLVFADADLSEAAEVGVTARCANAGQSCIAAKRFLVEESAFEPFVERFVGRMRARVVGDPRQRSTQVGPLARRDLRETLARQVEASVRAGARVLLGGRVPPVRGFFYPPTVLDRIPAGSPAAEEELFGPVATVAAFRTEEEALGLANGTAYGLGASLWTSDPARVGRLVPRIEAGTVAVNGQVKSDPRLPFGGVKDSGFGRELGVEGIREFTNRKAVWVRR